MYLVVIAKEQPSISIPGLDPQESLGVEYVADAGTGCAILDYNHNRGIRIDGLWVGVEVEYNPVYRWLYDNAELACGQRLEIESLELIVPECEITDQVQIEQALISCGYSVGWTISV